MSRNAEHLGYSTGLSNATCRKDCAHLISNIGVSESNGYCLKFHKDLAKLRDSVLRCQECIAAMPTTNDKEMD